MIRPPNSRHTPNLEDILNRGRPEPAWRDHLADWWDRVDLVEMAFALVLVAFGLPKHRWGAVPTPADWDAVLSHLGNGASIEQVGHMPGMASPLRIRRKIEAVIQIEAAVTLQLDARKVWHPSDQPKIIQAVASSYKSLLDAPMPHLLTSQMKRPAA